MTKKSTVEPLVGDRQARESKKAVIACNDYLRMGPGRSLNKLVQKYNENSTEKPPSKHRATLAKWSGRFEWVMRSEEYDAQQDKVKSQVADEIMRTGLALAYMRVEELNWLFTLLKEQITEKRKLWVHDVKQIGQGENAERVDIERYNTSLITDLRGVLDDLAKETGGRIKKTEHSGPEGNAIPLEIFDKTLRKVYGMVGDGDSGTD